MLTIKNKHTRILIFIVCAVLGFMITMQLKSQQRYQTVSVQRAEELSVRLKEVQADRDKLDKELSEYRAGRVSDTVQKEMEALRSRAGETALEGKGVILTIDDSNQAIKAGENKNLYIIHDEDLLRVINELRAAGAEAIALNGQRLVSTSEVRCGAHGPGQRDPVGSALYYFGDRQSANPGKLFKTAGRRIGKL